MRSTHSTSLLEQELFVPTGYICQRDYETPDRIRAILGQPEQCLRPVVDFARQVYRTAELIEESGRMPEVRLFFHDERREFKVIGSDRIIVSAYVLLGFRYVPVSINNPEAHN
tara:strand:- start:145 stop:483 length:339 start_codon:yes stop_codon:yes gene_type:complete